ncbi:hypothetical protein SAMN03159341_10494 [Paenibacillus sp. 1_12]|uniref:DUF6886 family protein n=1 Tax=Paenibacillus sp. 1_12 TaxID=1566278 RepID=UPI0008E2209D|nr:DUF6886 family protein [Paenibacillus sp. 1_12]SFL22204.1 hypothetical protein SAMN03159341_10494 [Paenibacillus sp. 1_12]
MKLYHFSEEANIEVFVPRKLEYRVDEPAQVWTIDEFHAPHYLFPRDCPRVCIWPKEDTTEQDYNLFFGHSRTNRMVAVETGWIDRIRKGCIYRYVFKADEFKLYEPNAGYYTTTHTVKPVVVERVDDLLGGLTALGIEVRITPSLIPLKQSIATSTINFSMIRMKNAIQE